MKSFYNVTFIASVFKSDNSLEENLKLHEGFLHTLKTKGLSFKEVNGVFYGYNEKSVVVIGWQDTDAINHCKAYDQDCVLRLDQFRRASFVLQNGTIRDAGDFKPVSKDFKGNCTIDPTTGIKYGIIK